jgi:hypothetical protein
MMIDQPRRVAIERPTQTRARMFMNGLIGRQPSTDAEGCQIAMVRS